MRALSIFLFLLLTNLADATEPHAVSGESHERTQGAQGCFPEYGLELHIYLQQ